MLLTIGEFSRMTHLSVKALRHYDDVGLMSPAQVDNSSSYRRYTTGQVPIAQVIRRFRDLDMPLEEIRTVLNTPDVAVRDQAILAHLQRMQETIERTQATVASLQALLDGNRPTLPVEYPVYPGHPAIAIRGMVDWDDTEPWLKEALPGLDQTVDSRSSGKPGPDATLYSGEFFEAHVGEVTAFVPVRGEDRDHRPRGAGGESPRPTSRSLCTAAPSAISIRPTSRRSEPSSPNACSRPTGRSGSITS